MTAVSHPLLRLFPQKPTHVTPFSQSRPRLPAVCYCRSPEWQPGRRLQQGSSITLQCVLKRRASRLSRSDSLASHHVLPPLPSPAWNKSHIVFSLSYCSRVAVQGSFYIGGSLRTRSYKGAIHLEWGVEALELHRRICKPERVKVTILSLNVAAWCLASGWPS